MAYVPSQTSATPAEDQEEGPVQLSQNAVLGTGGGGGVVDAQNQNKQSQSGSGASFNRYATLLKPQGRKLAQDFVSGIEDRNRAGLQKELGTARTNFQRDRGAATNIFNQGALDRAISSTKSNTELARNRKRGYTGPAGLEQTGMQAVLQRAQADRNRLNTAGGRREMLTQTQGITPGMSALDNFLMQRQGDVFEGADFASRLRGEAGEASTLAEGQAEETRLGNIGVAERTEAGLRTATEQQLAEYQQNQKLSDQARHRIMRGENSADDLARVGLTQQQIQQLRSGLSGANAGRSAAPRRGIPGSYGSRVPNQTLDERIGNQYGSRGLLDAFMRSRYGGNPNSNKMQGKYSQLNTTQGIIDNLINPSLSGNKIDTGYGKLDRGYQTLDPYLSRSGVTNADVQRLNALENLSGVDVGDISATGGAIDYSKALRGVTDYGTSRDRQYNEQTAQQNQSVARALNQAAKDRASGYSGSEQWFRRFDG